MKSSNTLFNLFDLFGDRTLINHLVQRYEFIIDHDLQLMIFIF